MGENPWQKGGHEELLGLVGLVDSRGRWGSYARGYSGKQLDVQVRSPATLNLRSSRCPGSELLGIRKTRTIPMVERFNVTLEINL